MEFHVNSIVLITKLDVLRSAADNQDFSLAGVLVLHYTLLRRPTCRQPTEQIMYIWTLDSHDCIGPFPTHDAAHAYAKRHGYTSYMLCDCPPFEYTIPHPPLEHAP